MRPVDNGGSKLPDHVRARILGEQGVAQSTDAAGTVAQAMHPTAASAEKPIPDRTQTKSPPTADLSVLHAALGLLSEEHMQLVLTGLPAHQLASALEQVLRPDAIEPAEPSSTGTEADGARERGAERTKTLRAAKIIYNDNMSVTDCEIRNMSDTGCCISVESVFGIPNLFTLNILNGKSRRECEVVWRKQKTLGLKFLD